MIDDYLYVTTNLHNAKDFLDMMKKGMYLLFCVFGDLTQILGHPEYGCFISQDKTLTNFDAGDGSLDLVDPSQKSESLIICPVPHSS